MNLSKQTVVPQEDLSPTDDPLLGKPLDVRFRHSFWQHKRPHVYAALVRTRPGQQILDRFENCGSNAWVMRCVEHPERFRVHANTCHSRWCDACSREKRLILSRNIRSYLRPGRIRFITLTLIASREPLADQVKKIYRCFKLLRRHSKIRNKMKGGVGFLEITKNGTTNCWHVHLHVLCDGHYIDQKQLSLVWHSITKDSYIVDIRIIRNPDVAVSYVVKYASKGVSPNIWHSETDLVEVMSALHGTRVFNTFGSWRGLKLTAEPNDDLTWKPFDRLSTLLQLARTGDEDAKKIVVAACRLPTRPSREREPPNH